MCTHNLLTNSAFCFAGARANNYVKLRECLCEWVLSYTTTILNSLFFTTHRELVSFIIVDWRLFTPKNSIIVDNIFTVPDW